MSGCRSCGARAPGRFCPECGERSIDIADYSLGRLAVEFIEALTSFDNRLWRTLRALFGRPGELTVAWREGRRAPYLKVFQLLVLATIVYFLAVQWLGVGNMFGTPLAGHVEWKALWHQPLARHMVEEHLAGGKEDFAALAARFDARSNALAELLIFLVAPVLTLAFALFVRGRYFAEHVVFATHLTTFLLLFILPVVLLVQLVQLPLRALGVSVGGDLLASAVAVPWLGWWFWQAMGRAYGFGRLLRALWIPLGIALVVFAIQAYRAMLFLLAWWSVT